MAQIGPKTILQTYVEHQGSTNQKKGTKNAKNKVVRQQPRQTGWPIANRSTASKKLVESAEPVAHPVDRLIGWEKLSNFDKIFLGEQGI